MHLLHAIAAVSQRVSKSAIVSKSRFLGTHDFDRSFGTSIETIQSHGSRDYKNLLPRRLTPGDFSLLFAQPPDFSVRDTEISARQDASLAWGGRNSQALVQGQTRAIACRRLGPFGVYRGEAEAGPFNESQVRRRSNRRSDRPEPAKSVEPRVMIMRETVRLASKHTLSYLMTSWNKRSFSASLPPFCCWLRSRRSARRSRGPTSL